MNSKGGVFGFIFLVFVVGIILGSDIAAAASTGKDVAYVYRKNYKIDQNIVGVFKGLGLNVSFFQEGKLPKDILSYKILYVGDENFVNPPSIPVGKMPSVVANNPDVDEWGLVDKDGASQLSSNKPLSVLKGNRQIQVYTQAKNGRIGIPYYYLDQNNIAPGLERIAGTDMTLDGGTLGDVISFSPAGSPLSRGRTLQANLCFYGIIESDFWTPAAKQMFIECAESVAIECFTDIECTDNNNRTQDICLNPGTVLSECVNLPIECFNDLECGEDGYVSEEMCTLNNVTRQFQTFTCENAGTANSSCSSEVKDVVVEECSDICSNGQCYDVACYNDLDCDDADNYTKDSCLNPGTIEAECKYEDIACFTENDCGVDGFIGDNFCAEDSVVRKYQDFGCENPGNTNSSCTLEVSDVLIEECSFMCSEGGCISGVHDVALVEFNGSVGGVKIEYPNGTDVLLGSTLNCNQNYKVSIKAENIGDFAENITYIGSIDEIELEYTDTFNLLPSSSSVKTDTINLSLEEGTYNVEVEAINLQDENTDNNFAYREIVVSCRNPNIECFNDLDCDDLDSYTFDRCLNPGTEQSVCTHDPIACLTDLDCDDNLENTTDMCHNPGQINSFCTNHEKENPHVECYLNSDCGIDGFQGASYCSINNDVSRNYIEYTCNNPGSENSFCSNSIEQRVVQDCAVSCSFGQCTTNPPPQNITCKTNSECGTDGYVSAEMCTGNNVTRQYKTYICNSPNTVQSYCSSSVNNQLIQQCSFTCSDGICLADPCVPTNQETFGPNYVVNTGEINHGTYKDGNIAVENGRLRIFVDGKADNDQSGQPEWNWWPTYRVIKNINNDDNLRIEVDYEITNSNLSNVKEDYGIKLVKESSTSASLSPTGCGIEAGLRKNYAGSWVLRMDECGGSKADYALPGNLDFEQIKAGKLRVEVVNGKMTVAFKGAGMADWIYHNKQMSFALTNSKPYYHVYLTEQAHYKVGPHFNGITKVYFDNLKVIEGEQCLI